MSYDPMFRVAGDRRRPRRRSARRRRGHRPLHGRTAPRSRSGDEVRLFELRLCLLGRIVEKVTGQAYDEHVKAAVLTPAGPPGCAWAGRLKRTGPPERSCSRDYSGAPLAESVFPAGPEEVPWPYGGFAIEPMDAHGGWLASARDLPRFVLAVDGRTATPDVLQPASIALMVDRPPLAEYSGSATYYALGWQVRPTGGDANWWHTGSLRAPRRSWSGRPAT
ncbi:MAG: beta-lactamase family protein [Candidatus Moduliflexus flocculans]|nr:beta-lactamase family protein [Candidatus Moduliflexus flocculans]